MNNVLLYVIGYISQQLRSLKSVWAKDEENKLQKWALGHIINIAINS